MSHFKEAFILTTLLMGCALVLIGTFGMSGLSGAAIGSRTSVYTPAFFTGAFLVIFSALLGIWSGERARENNIETIINVNRLKEKMKKVENDKNKPVFIMDSSILIQYSDIADTIKELRSGGSDIIIPRKVVDEITYHKQKTALASLENNVNHIERYRAIARSYLEKSPKNQFSKTLNGEPVTSNRERAIITHERLNILKRIMKDKGSDYVPNQEDFKRYAGKSYGVSETDVDVLATAIYESEHNQRRAIICENDKDFKSAVERVNEMLRKKKKPEITLISPYKTVWDRN